MPFTRRAAAALAWLAAVVGATAIGLTAVGAIGAGIVGASPAPLTEGQVRALLATSPVPFSPTSAPQPGPAAPTVLASAGGTVLASCVDGAVRIVSKNPAQGYQLHDEPGEDPGRVRFESGSGRVEMQLSCRDEVPEASVRVKD
jgi:hypothetical protein